MFNITYQTKRELTLLAGIAILLACSLGAFGFISPQTSTTERGVCLGLIVGTAIGFSYLLVSLREKSQEPLTPHQEICAIKDRLYQDMVRLETLQGHQTASDNVRRIIHKVWL